MGDRPGDGAGGPGDAEGFYEAHAPEYARKNRENAYNSLYERPATMELLGDVRGLRVLDAGCGPGAHLEELVRLGATATGCDRNAALLATARSRLGDRVRLDQADLRERLPYEDAAFDAVLCSLVLHYLEEWTEPLRELRRVLRPDGRLVVSTHHPVVDYRLSGSEDYFATELWTDSWCVEGEWVPIRYFRRPLSAMTEAFAAAGFALERIAEPQPSAAMRDRFPEDFARLSTTPGFLFFVLHR